MKTRIWLIGIFWIAVWTAARAMDDWETSKTLGDPRVILIMIGVIDADNTYNTVYGVGYFGLGPLTKVHYSPFHDGAWWRRWWAINKTRFSPEAQTVPIPEFPKTSKGKSYIPFPDSLDTFEGREAWLRDQLKRNKSGNLELRDIAEYIADSGDPRAIPLLIGAIDADNSHDTIHGIGGALYKLTKVNYREYHDGAWWRRWWKDTQSRFPEKTRNYPIPDFPKTSNGKKYKPFPENMETFEGRTAYLERTMRNKPGPATFFDIGSDFADAGDPRAIPVMIGAIRADNSYDTLYGLGYFGLRRLTGVEYNEKHDAAWWMKWWKENRDQFPEAARNTPIPDFTGKGWKDPLTSFHSDATEKPSSIGNTEAKIKGTDVNNGDEDVKEAPQKSRNTNMKEVPGKYKNTETSGALEDVLDVPSSDTLIGGDPKKRYFLIGPVEGAAPPEGGYKLAIILPGGDGSAAFNPFVRRILKNALGPEWIAAQPVAFQWRSDQQIVWPTQMNPVPGQQFSTEEFVETVIADVKTRRPINPRHIVMLSWSSSGPAAYAISLRSTKSITGSYIAMSVFRPNRLPSLTNAKGHRYVIDHSRDDSVCPFSQSQKAVQELERVGAEVKFLQYEGGHGWRGNAYTRIQEGMTWLTRP